MKPWRRMLRLGIASFLLASVGASATATTGGASRCDDGRRWWHFFQPKPPPEPEPSFLSGSMFFASKGSGGCSRGRGGSGGGGGGGVGGGGSGFGGLGGGGGFVWVALGTLTSMVAVAARGAMSTVATGVRRAVERQLWTTVEVGEDADPKLFRALIRWLHARELLKRPGRYRAMSSTAKDLAESASSTPGGGGPRQQQRRRLALSARFDRVEEIALIPLTDSGDGGRFRVGGRVFWARIDGGAGSGDGLPVRTALVFGAMRGGNNARRAAKQKDQTKPSKLTLTTLNTKRGDASDGSAAIAAVLREALIAADAEDTRHFEVYELVAAANGGTAPRWDLSTLARKRPPESVILAAGIMQDLLQDVTRWIRDEEWYLQRAVPHRRGYLLHGPPGTGKSSLIAAVASHFDLPLCSLSLSRLRGTTSLSDALAAAPPNALVAIEDVDAAFRVGATRRTDDETNATTTTTTTTTTTERAATAFLDHQQQGVSLHELLNAIDGLAATTGRLLFLSTNHCGHLDDALVRPGRCDRAFYLGHADDDMARRLFEQFFFFKDDDAPVVAADGDFKSIRDDDDDDDSANDDAASASSFSSSAALETKTTIAAAALAFGNLAVGQRRSMAELQGLLLRHRSDPQGALEHARLEWGAGGAR